jgi:hypothetical protein
MHICSGNAKIRSVCSAQSAEPILSYCPQYSHAPLSSCCLLSMTSHALIPWSLHLHRSFAPSSSGFGFCGVVVLTIFWQSWTTSPAQPVAVAIPRSVDSAQKSSSKGRALANKWARVARGCAASLAAAHDALAALAQLPRLTTRRWR